MPRPAERLGYYPHQLSGGLRQRVMIAMALACSPKLLIADEPTTALDVTIQAQILDLIDELRRDLKMAVILITHDLGVIAARAEPGDGDVRRQDRRGRGHRRAVRRRCGTRTRRRSSARSRASTTTARRRCTRSRASRRICPRASWRAGSRRAAATRPSAAASRSRCSRRSPARASPGGREHTALRPARREPAASTSSRASIPCDACRRPPSQLGSPSRIAVRERRRPGRAAEREVLLQIDHLVKEFPVTAGAVIQRKLGTVKAVSDVSFSVRRGETFGLVGESGCGKTTIGWLIVALAPGDGGLDPVRGRGGDDAARVGAAAPAPRPAADVPGSVRVARPADARRPDRARAARRPGHRVARRSSARASASCSSEVGLSPRAAELYPHEFSGGQRQRIGLARALALNPKLIVADEPVSALDVSIQAQILNLMRELQRAHQLTYIVISHDLAVVKYLADTIGVMYLGKLVEIGPAEEIYARAAHPYTRGLIDAIAIPDPVARAGAQGRAGARRAAVGDHAAVGLPLPHPLPAGAADLRRGGAAAPPVRAGRTSRPATSRCRRPPSD